MKQLVLSRRAQADLTDICLESEARFGGAVRRRYEQLEVAALRALATDSMRHGVIADPDLPPDVRLYHLRHARGRTEPGERIARPRHLIVFTSDDERLEIVRVLQDAMDLSRHL